MSLALESHVNEFDTDIDDFEPIEQEELDELDGFEQPMAYYYETEAIIESPTRATIEALEVSEVASQKSEFSLVSEATEIESTLAHRGSFCSDLSIKTLEADGAGDYSDDNIVTSDDEDYEAARNYSDPAPGKLSEADLKRTNQSNYSWSDKAVILPKSRTAVKSMSAHAEVPKLSRYDPRTPKTAHRSTSESGFKTASEVLRDMQASNSGQ